MLCNRHIPLQPKQCYQLHEDHTPLLHILGRRRRIRADAFYERGRVLHKVAHALFVVRKAGLIGMEGFKIRIFRIRWVFDQRVRQRADHDIDGVQNAPCMLLLLLVNQIVR